MITGLNLGGWIFLICAWTFILSITIFCVYKILFHKKSTTPPKKKIED